MFTLIFHQCFSLPFFRHLRAFFDWVDLTRDHIHVKLLPRHFTHHPPNICQTGMFASFVYCRMNMLNGPHIWPNIRTAWGLVNKSVSFQRYPEDLSFINTHAHLGLLSRDFFKWNRQDPDSIVKTIEMMGWCWDDVCLESNRIRYWPNTKNLLPTLSDGHVKCSQHFDPHGYVLGEMSGLKENFEDNY